MSTLDRSPGKPEVRSLAGTAFGVSSDRGWPGRTSKMASTIAPASSQPHDGLTAMPAATTIGQYIIDRLHAMGVDHVFGIPGDYVLTLYKMLEESPIEIVGMTREDSAGFAADAYARIRGL